jgi:hypothetical protein
MGFSFKPKSEKFFLLFEQAAANLRLGSAALEDLCAP